MTASVESHETTRGAEIGPPDVVSRRPTPREPRFGPLPQPSLVDRLRASWSLEALVPAFDHDARRRRQWRAGFVTAIVLHVVALVGIVVIGKYAIRTFGPEPETARIIDFKNADVAEATTDEPEPTESGGAPKDGPANAGSDTGGGASNTAHDPVSAGAPPPPSPKPLPAPVLPPAPGSLTVPITVPGPSVEVTPPSQIGIPTAPPGESPGNQGGVGIGTGHGGEYGPGRDTGPGGSGAGPGGGGHDGSAQTPGGTNPVGTGLGENLAPPSARDHEIRFVKKARPAIPPAMVEAGTFGTVRIRITVGPDGTILSAEPLDRLANGGTQAALDALYRCRFEPAVRSGKYVTSTTVVRFEITQPGA